MAQENSQKNIFKISIHNIREINRTLDQDNILQELKEHKIDILGLSKTKLTYETAKYSFKDQDEYKTFHACNDESSYSAGVSLLVHKSMSKNIHQVFRIDGNAVIINFYFKGRRKL